MDIFKASMGQGVALGIGATFLLPATARIVGSIVKPVIKETIKGGLYVYDTGKAFAAEIGETFEDISAEARSEMKKDQSPAKNSKEAKDTKAKTSTS